MKLFLYNKEWVHEELDFVRRVDETGVGSHKASTGDPISKFVLFQWNFH